MHLYIFALESVLFRRPAGWRTFGVLNQDDADTIRLWAFNQGFYNLFLALGAIVGVALSRSGDPLVAAGGAGMTLLATVSMVLAAVVLVSVQPRLARAAAVQGIAPLIAVVAQVVG